MMAENRVPAERISSRPLLEMSCLIGKVETRMKNWLIAWLLAAGTGLAAPVNPNALRAAAAYSNRAGGTSFLAMQNGQTLMEENAGEAHKIYSGTKAFWCLAALAAADDGLLS